MLPDESDFCATKYCPGIEVFCAAGIVPDRHTAWAQSYLSRPHRPTSGAHLRSAPGHPEHFGLCLSLLPDIEETPPASALLCSAELVADRAERRPRRRRKCFTSGEQHRELLDLSYTRSGFNPRGGESQELVRATRSEDTRERYRAVMHLQYLSRSDLPPPAWRAAADVMRDPRNDYLISMMAANMLAAHRQRGGPDITQVFFEAMRDNPRCADPFASERRRKMVLAPEGLERPLVGARQVRPATIRSDQHACCEAEFRMFPRLAAFRQRRARLRELDYDSPDRAVLAVVLVDSAT